MEDGGKMLKRVFVLKQETQIFMEEKGKPVAELYNDERVCEFVVVMGTSTHLN
jgi:hypothetical protein